MSIELKICSVTAEKLCEIVGGKLETYGSFSSECIISSLSTSSLDVIPGCLFCAIKGERADGNDFVPDAVDRGAVCVLSERSHTGTDRNFCAVIVEDTVQALGLFASWYRMQSKAKVIGVTGSVGKTTTKEMISSVLEMKYKTHKTSGNYNNELGLPLTIFGLDKETEYAVLELGMSEFGEIEYLSGICRPDAAVITVIGTSHIANLGSRENISRAKLEIVSGMNENGTLLFNADEPLLSEKVPFLKTKTVPLSILSGNGRYNAVNIRETAENVTFDIECSGKTVKDIKTGVPGKHNVFNALCAYVIGEAEGIGEELIRKGILSYTGIKMRQNFYSAGPFTVIDDCYNASPESMKAALDLLMTYSREKKLCPMALLGDMLELGDDSPSLHFSVGEHMKGMEIERLFTYGPLSVNIAAGAAGAGIPEERITSVPETGRAKEMADIICSYAEEGGVLLVKASRGTHAEEVIEEIKKKFKAEEE